MQDLLREAVLADTRRGDDHVCRLLLGEYSTGRGNLLAEATLDLRLEHRWVELILTEELELPTGLQIEKVRELIRPNPCGARSGEDDPIDLGEVVSVARENRADRQVPPRPMRTRAVEVGDLRNDARRGSLEEPAKQLDRFRRPMGCAATKTAVVMDE